MNYKDTMNIPTAIDDSTKMDLSCKHITTANWMQLNPIYWKEMVPGENLKVGVENFTRLNPLVTPTFAPGSKLKVSRFFVPFRTIYRGWNDFITDSVHVPSLGTDKNVAIQNKVPVVTNNVLIDAFTNHWDIPGINSGFGNTFAVEVQGTDAAYDFVVKPEDWQSGPGTKYRFTSLGQHAYKIITSLGYRFTFNESDTQEYSALPLLAYAKVYADYYWPSAYMDNYNHYLLESLFNADNGVELSLTAQQVFYILVLCTYVCYDSDYFVSAFDNPVAPSTGNYSQLTLKDYSLPSPFNMNAASTGTTVLDRSSQVVNFNQNYSSNTGVTVSDSKGTPFIMGSNPSYFGVLTQYADSMLHRLTDYMKRHQLAGRAMERYLARFGKSLSAEKLNRSVYLGTDITSIQIGDVMSTSDTVQEHVVSSGAKAADTGSTGSATTITGSQLGAYAGKGIAYSKNDYDGFSTDEYGIYIITASLVPDVFYDQGIDPSLYHVYKSEFYTPEFNYGMRSITASELYVPMNGMSAFSGPSAHTQVFGFTPRYAEYRVGKSRLTGSFTIPTLNGNSEFGSDAWHMMRKVDASSFGGSLTGCVHSPSFVYGFNDAGQYNRIFFNDDYDAPDQFVMIYSFNVQSYSPMPSLYENYDWCDEQKGRNITMPVNGVKVN